MWNRASIKTKGHYLYVDEEGHIKSSYRFTLKGTTLSSRLLIKSFMTNSPHTFKKSGGREDQGGNLH